MFWEPEVGFPQLSYSQHYRGGHGILERDYIMSPTTVLTWDPCSFGQPIILTVGLLPKTNENGGCREALYGVVVDGLVRPECEHLWQEPPRQNSWSILCTNFRFCYAIAGQVSGKASWFPRPGDTLLRYAAGASAQTSSKNSAGKVSKNIDITR